VIARLLAAAVILCVVLVVGLALLALDSIMRAVARIVA
jgi:hypothetical protein